MVTKSTAVTRAVLLYVELMRTRAKEVQVSMELNRIVAALPDKEMDEYMKETARMA